MDIIIQEENRTILVQCKAHAASIGPGPIRELAGVVSAPHGGTPVVGLMISTNGYTVGAKTFADEIGIELWSVDDLLDIADKLEKPR